jgi:hypothetical protein
VLLVVRSLQAVEVPKALSRGRLKVVSTPLELMLIDSRLTLRRPSVGDEDNEASDPRRSFSCLGASGIAGTGLSL